MHTHYKKQLFDKIHDSLKAELVSLGENPALAVRKAQVRDLLEHYKSYPEHTLKRNPAIQLGSLVLVVEEWSDQPRERWYFVGFGGELPLEHSDRRIQVVSLDYFQNQQVGGAFETQETQGTNEMSLTHRIVYSA